MNWRTETALTPMVAQAAQMDSLAVWWIMEKVAPTALMASYLLVELVRKV